MQKLIERMLAVRTGFAKNHRSGDIIQRLAKAVDRLSVRLHIDLLQMGRKSRQGLRVRQYSRCFHAEHISLVDTDQGIQHIRILQRILLLRELILRVRAIEELREHLWSEGQGQHRAANCGRRGIPSADVIIHEERIEISRVLRQRRRLARDRDHVLRGIKPFLLQRVLYKRLIRQRLQRRAGF